MKSSSPVLLFLFAALVAVGGCEKAPASSGGGGQQVRLGYFANVTHAQGVLGASSGEFQQALAPAKLTTKTFNAGPSLIEALFAKQIDIGYVGPGPAIAGWNKSRGQGLRVIAGVAANGVLIVARKDAGITTLADLKGKKIATPQLGNTQDISARHFFLSELKQSDTNNVVPIPNAEQAGLMKRGRIDAAWSVEPWGSRLIASAGAVLVAKEQQLWPNNEVTLTVIVVRPDFLAAHSDLVEKLLGVHHAWTLRLQQDAARYVPDLDRALEQLTGKRLPKGVLASAVANVKFTDDPLEPTLQAFARWTHELGFARQQPNLDGMVDLNLLKRVTGN